MGVAEEDEEEKKKKEEARAAYAYQRRGFGKSKKPTCISIFRTTAFHQQLSIPCHLWTPEHEPRLEGSHPFLLLGFMMGLLVLAWKSQPNHLSTPWIMEDGLHILAGASAECGACSSLYHPFETEGGKDVLG